MPSPREGATAIEDNAPPAFRLMLTLRRAGVSDPRVLAAFENCPRENFLAPEFAGLGMEDVSVPLPCGQTSLRPSVLALMLDALSIDVDNRVLLVGAGAGYSAGILSRLAGQVFALERYKTLSDLTAANCTKAGARNVTFLQADGLAGLPALAPFDRILLTGAVAALPQDLIAQLTPDGLLAAPVLRENGSAILQLYRAVGSALTEMFALDSERLEPGLARSL